MYIIPLDGKFFVYLRVIKWRFYATVELYSVFVNNFDKTKFLEHSKRHNKLFVGNFAQQLLVVDTFDAIKFGLSFQCRKCLCANVSIQLQLVKRIICAINCVVKCFVGNEILYEVDKTTNDLSDAISNDLRKRGMKFVGSTIIYSYLQAIGVIYSHDKDCYMYQMK